MTSKIFLCLLLIVAMLSFVGCGDNGTTEDKIDNAVNDVADGVDDIANNDNGNFGSGNVGDARPNGNGSIGSTGVDNQHKTSDGALTNDMR